MPRLSIIIPHRHDDARLEATVLSVLENRPANSEVIIVHDGSYGDPYSLGDEVVFVEVDRGSNVVQLINAGTMAACSPVVHTLIAGVSVSSDWTETAVESLSGVARLAAVAISVEHGDGQRTCGTNLSTISTPWCHSTIPKIDCGSPELTCGFYRRKVLLALGGFNEALDPLAADIDFALALHELNLQTAEDAATHAFWDCPVQRKPSARQVRQFASLAVQYGFASGGLVDAAGTLARGFAMGHPLAAFGWCAGALLAPRDPKKHLARLSIAKVQLADQDDAPIVYTATLQKRAA